jgi:hypothetical protein
VRYRKRKIQAYGDAGNRNIQETERYREQRYTKDREITGTGRYKRQGDRRGREIQ